MISAATFRTAAAFDGGNGQKRKEATPQAASPNFNFLAQRTYGMGLPLFP